MLRRHNHGAALGRVGSSTYGVRFQSDNTGPKKPSQDLSRNPAMSDGTCFRPQDFWKNVGEAEKKRQEDHKEKYGQAEVSSPLFVWNVGPMYDPLDPDPKGRVIIPNRFKAPAAPNDGEDMPYTTKPPVAPPTDASSGQSSSSKTGAPEPGSAGAEERSQATAAASKTYVRSQEFFSEDTIKLRESFAGDDDRAQVATWELIFYNYWRWFFTGETMAGKDRHGNVFTRKYDAKNPRQEKRQCFRVALNQRHLPYGALPTDSKNWSIWMRNQRNSIPTWAEEEQARTQTLAMMGAKAVGDEAPEDVIVRSSAHTAHASALLQELDSDEQYNKFVHHYETNRMRENNPQKETSTWTVGFARADWLYNEEETETMRTSMGHLYRDREWQALEIKRHKRTQTMQRNRQYGAVVDGELVEGEPPKPRPLRPDSWVPCLDGIEELTTPELQKLRTEVDYLEDDRLNLRRELGLTDITDIHEGRAPIVKDGQDGPFGMDPVSKRFKPRVWKEVWGTGGGFIEHPSAVSNPNPAPDIN